MMMDFIKAAALAPSTRNTRPWILNLSEHTVRLLPDFKRWLPVDDPDQKQLYVSLGCALENVLITAQSLMQEAKIEWGLEQDDPYILVKLSKNVHLPPSALFDSLEKRHTHRGSFAQQAVEPLFIERIQALAGGSVMFIEDGRRAIEIEKLNMQSEIELYSNPAFCEEFDAKQEIATWLHPSIFIRKLNIFSRLYLHQDFSQVCHPAPLVGILFVKEWDRKQWVEIGLLLQQIFLIAESFGIKFRPISNCFRTEKWRCQVQSLLPGSSGIPTIGFYCGY